MKPDLSLMIPHAISEETFMVTSETKGVVDEVVNLLGTFTI